MRSRFIFEMAMRLLILISLGALGACSAKAKITEKISNPQDFVLPALDEKIKSFVAANSAATELTPAWKQLSRLEADINQLRANNPRQSEVDEIYIETVVSVMKDFPRRGEFKKENCASYKAKILKDFLGDDSAQKSKTKPSAAIAKGLQVFQVFCKEI